MSDNVIPLGKKRVNLIGQRFGRLVVTSDGPSRKTPSGQIKRRLVCHCDCGNTCLIAHGNLRSGHTTSCGCVHEERVLAAKTKHGRADTPIYRVWSGMRNRCYNPKNHAFRHYGGRGITVCQQWRESFAVFYRDMGDIPFPGAEIDRIDNDGSYAPGNCRWATRQDQANNKSSNRHLTLGDTTRTLTEWAAIIETKPSVLNARLKRGWSVERTLAEPIH